MNATLIVFLMTVGFMAGFFLVIRGAVLWYCRINEHIENQKNIIKLLEVN